MKIKIEQFLLDEEKKDIRSFVHELHKKKDLAVADFIESGAIGVKVDDIFNDGTVLYSVYRTVAMVRLKQKKESCNHR